MKNLLILLSLTCLPMFGQIEVTTSTPDIFYRGTQETAGAITFRIAHNAFPGASTQNPAYIGVSLDHGVTLANTLVDLNASDETNQPIFLSAIMTAQFGFSNAMPSEALSIVRWVAGEDSFWIRVQSSSSTWVNDGFSTSAPSEQFPVTFRVGISAQNSYLGGLNAGESGYSVPFNSRNSNANIFTTDDALSTMLCVDLSQSSLTTVDSNNSCDALLRFYATAYDHTAELGDGTFAAGNVLDVGVETDTIARGKTYDCSVVGTSEVATATDGNTTILNTHEIRYSCDQSSLPLDLHDNSYTRLSLGDGDVGFSLANAVSGNQYIVVPVGQSFQLNGETVYKTIDVYWVDGTLIGGRFNIDLKVVATYTDLATVDEIRIGWDLFLATGPDPLDTGVFFENHQLVSCEPSLLYMGSGQLFHAGPIVKRQELSKHGQKVIGGSKVVLTSDGEGSFQWLKDGELIAGATKRHLVLNQVNQRDSGAYACLVNGQTISEVTQIVVVSTGGL